MAEPVGRQRETIRQANQRVNIWEGSIRSGKTVSSLIRWMIHAASGPPGELMMVGKTERSLKRNVLDVLGDEIKLKAGIGEARIFGRRCYIQGAADTSAEAKIRGVTLVGAYGDQIETWPEEVYNQLYQRMSARGAKFFGTANPDHPTHWLKTKWIDKQSDERKALYHFTLRDNPFLDREYIEDLERSFTGLWKKRFIDGLWVLASGAIYDMWDEDRHCVDFVPECKRFWVGIDYGTAKVFSAILFGLGAADNRIYAISEYRWDVALRGRQRTDAEYSEDVQEWLKGQECLNTTAPFGRTTYSPPEWLYVDPSATSFLQQLWRDGVRGVREADNDVDDGLRVVARCLAQRRLQVHRSCVGLIAEFPGYVWDEKVQQKGEKDRPVKQNDHSLDACRYGVYSSAYVWERLPLPRVESA